MIAYCEDHDDALIVFDRRECPICRLLAEKDGEIDDLRNQVERLESEAAENE